MCRRRGALCAACEFESRVDEERLQIEGILKRGGRSRDREGEVMFFGCDVRSGRVAVKEAVGGNRGGKDDLVRDEGWREVERRVGKRAASRWGKWWKLAELKGERRMDGGGDGTFREPGRRLGE